MNIKVSHLKKMRKNSKTKMERLATNPELTPSNQENMAPLHKRTDLVEKKLRETYECNSEVLRLAELWVGG